MFEIVGVKRRGSVALEAMGTKDKFWYRAEDRKMLFKAEERGTGEDWAEKVTCEFCELLGLPHVHYELALETESDIPGVVCETFTPERLSLALGNQLLLQQDEHYPAEERGKYKVREHTVDAVAATVEKLLMPNERWLSNLPDGIESPLDVFAGYIMLDAWVANQDRHHENWGAIRDGERLSLAPTFDHGASMARNLSDTERKDRLTTRDQGRGIPAFAARARSAFYSNSEEDRPLKTLDAWKAFAVKSQAAGIWLGQLKRIEENAINGILSEVPPNRMSRICREFTFELLRVNRNLLLKGLER